MISGDFLLRSGDREKSSKSGVSRRNRESWQVWLSIVQFFFMAELWAGRDQTIVYRVTRQRKTINSTHHTYLGPRYSWNSKKRWADKDIVNLEKNNMMKRSRVALFKTQNEIRTAMIRGFTPISGRLVQKKKKIQAVRDQFLVQLLRLPEHCQQQSIALSVANPNSTWEFSGFWWMLPWLFEIAEVGPWSWSNSYSIVPHNEIRRCIQW